MESVYLQELTPKDIKSEDRAFISTESGNRYMIRRSKSAGDKMKVYNERNHFNDGYEIVPRDNPEVIAETGKRFLFTMLGFDKETKSGRQGFNATKVTEIELRKGIEKLIASGELAGRKPSAAEEGLGNLAQMLRKHVTGKGSFDNEKQQSISIFDVLKYQDDEMQNFGIQKILANKPELGIELEKLMDPELSVEQSSEAIGNLNKTYGTTEQRHGNYNTAHFSLPNGGEFRIKVFHDMNDALSFGMNFMSIKK